MTAVQMPTISVYPREATSAVGKTAHLLLPLSLGEMLEAVVGARTGESRFELTIKNGSLSAFSELPLARGDRLTVKVEQLHPQVILSSCVSLVRRFLIPLNRFGVIFAYSTALCVHET